MAEVQKKKKKAKKDAAELPVYNGNYDIFIKGNKKKK